MSGLATRAALLLPALLVWGCSHHCGYVEEYVRTERAPELDQSQKEPSEPKVDIVQAPTATDAHVEVKVSRPTYYRSAIRCHHVGREVYVKYRPQDMILKPLLLLPVIPALWTPIRDPHLHGGKEWGAWNYLRDVFAWFNPFEAKPHGARVLGPRREFKSTIRYEWKTVEEGLIPDADVVAIVNKEILARSFTGENGNAVLDLSGALRRASPEKRLRLNIGVYLPDGDVLWRQLIVEPATLKAFQEGCDKPADQSGGVDNGKG